VAAHYLGALVGAVRLAPEYPVLMHFVERVHAGDAAAALSGSLATLLVMLGAAVSLARCVRAGKAERGRESAFVFAWTMAVVVALSVWGGLHEPGADRHAYLLLAPLGVALAALLARVHAAGAMLSSRRAVPMVIHGAVVATVLLVLAASASASRRQMEVWRSERTLWIHATAAGSASPRAHANMARVLAGDGEYEAAVAQMSTALTADSNDASLYLGRAALRCAQGHRFQARADLARAQQLGATAPMIAELARDCGLSIR
jgi:hypothetical protein